MQESNLIVVSSYGSRVEAELAKGALENAGIPAIIKSDTVGRMREHIAWSGAGFQILAREGDATAARDVLATSDASKTPDAGSEGRDRFSKIWRWIFITFAAVVLLAFVLAILMGRSFFEP